MVMETNRDIRLMAAGAGVYLWQIAQALNVTDSTFSRMLRRELSSEDKQKITTIIRSLSDASLCGEEK